MQDASYESYASEVSSWLHEGRRRLVDKVLSHNLGPLEETRSLLEVGAGVGQNVATLARYGAVDVMEINTRGVQALRQNPHVRTLYTTPVPCALERSYDVICALDVVEHLEDDGAALQWMAGHLKPQGLLLLTVPAYNSLYSDHDRALGHWRRYTAASLLRVIPKELAPVSFSYFNMLLLPAAVASRLIWQWRRRRATVPAVMDKQHAPTSGIVNALLGGIFFLEIRVFIGRMRLPFGLSLYTCHQKRPL